jgi:hypothetical protein
LRINDFPYDRFLKVKQERDKHLEDFILRGKGRIAVVQKPASDYTRIICRYKERQLESELGFLYDSFRCQSDFMYSFLEPWVGVGIYAAAFGCPFVWNDHDAPQTRTIVAHADDLKHLDLKPEIHECEPMIEVLERIEYFKQMTGGQLDIAITDTQSPNDTASLIVDACELFVTAMTDCELIHPLLQAITDTIIEFTKLQNDVIGECAAYPGHGMLSSRNIRGIAISDDNAAVLSPAVYRSIGLPYNAQISKQFGGLYLHSCGDFHQNYMPLKEMDDLVVIDCAIGKGADPNPNRIQKIIDAFHGSKIILKARIGSGDIHVLNELLESDIRMIIQFTSTDGIEEGNRTYNAIKNMIH